MTVERMQYGTIRAAWVKSTITFHLATRYAEAHPRKKGSGYRSLSAIEFKHDASWRRNGWGKECDLPCVRLLRLEPLSLIEAQ